MQTANRNPNPKLRLKNKGIYKMTHQEGVDAAHAHGRAVLLPYRRQVAKVQPLYRLGGAGGGPVTCSSTAARVHM